MTENQNETEDQCAARLQAVADQLSAAMGVVDATEDEMGDTLLAISLLTLMKTAGTESTARRFYFLAIGLYAGVVNEKASADTTAALRRAGFNLH